MTFAQMELRLTATIARAEQMAKDLRNAHESVVRLHASLTKYQAEEKAQLIALTQSVPALIRELKQEAHDAREQLRHIQAHIKWRTAVRTLFGEEGLNAVAEHMYAASVVEKQGEPA